MHVKGMTRGLMLVVAGALSAPLVAMAGNPLPTNPTALSFDSSYTNDQLFARSTGMLITGGCNANAAVFQQARRAGAEVLQYVNPVDVPVPGTPLCLQAQNLYGVDSGQSPLWPYPHYGARQNFPGQNIADLRAGSAWANTVVTYVTDLMRQGMVDGVFLDVLGARLWTGLAGWDGWPQSEKDAFTAGAIDLVRRLDAARRATNPKFIIVNNNYWLRGDSLGPAGERYVDGVSVEHHWVSETYSTQYAGRAFSNLGHRRVIVIARGTAEARAWAQIPGVTNVSDQLTSQYGHPNAPAIAFHPLH